MYLVRISAGILTILTEVFRDFPHCLQYNKLGHDVSEIKKMLWEGLLICDAYFYSIFKE
jgi:hypothetical protein